ncbi:hypothetical protein M407DRAFT_33239 [Tulasnella calospora MUT 4182]|uniref:non-chaperonin molecular chaperone ATPase n=1 Tax=Tulasnella calospora MUT 4182 TaxID=1051891 RepID=A0A0C3PR61_9AGAM|nr:hypothetical protein M407DRAFT_33239 [Tulasnella calospora MUT 4182]
MPRTYDRLPSVARPSPTSASGPLKNPSKRSPSCTPSSVTEIHHQHHQGVEEKHLKTAPAPVIDDLAKLCAPGNTYKVLIDGEVAFEGSLLEDFGLNLDKEIDDPEDRKPEDWADEAILDEDCRSGRQERLPYHINPKNIVFDAKRLITRRTEGSDVKKDMKHWPFGIVDRSGRPVIEVTHKEQFTSEEIPAMILGKMKESAEAYLGDKVTHAVVTVPAYFNDAQRSVAKDAVTIAGLTILRIVNEPSPPLSPTVSTIGRTPPQHFNEVNPPGLTNDHQAASGSVRPPRTPVPSPVSFQVSGTEKAIENGVFEVLATAADTHLGGEDFDQPHHRLHGPAITPKLEIESFDDGNDFSETFTRTKFEELNLDLCRKTLKPVEQALKDSGMKKEGIDDVVLVGTLQGDQPDEAVAWAAALQGYILSGEKGTDEVLLIDVCPMNLGIETAGGIFMRIMHCNTLYVPPSQLFDHGYDLSFTLASPSSCPRRSPPPPITSPPPPSGSSKANEPYQGQRSPQQVRHHRHSRGVPQIESSFEIDANVIVKVGTVEKGTRLRILLINKIPFGASMAPSWPSTTRSLKSGPPLLTPILVARTSQPSRQRFRPGCQAQVEEGSLLKHAAMWTSLNVRVPSFRSLPTSTALIGSMGLTAATYTFKTGLRYRP